MMKSARVEAMLPDFTAESRKAEAETGSTRPISIALVSMETETESKGCSLPAKEKEHNDMNRAVEKAAMQ